MIFKRVCAVLCAVAVVLAVSAVAQKPADNAVAQLNGGLEAQIVSAGLNTRDAIHPRVTIAMKLSNKGSSTAFVLLFGPMDLLDDSGVHYDLKTLTGIAYCPGPQTNPPSFRFCVGVPRVDANTFSPRGYTRIDAGRSITVNLSFQGSGQPGTQVTLSGEYAYRVVADATKDADLSDADKLKQIQLGTLSFEPVAVSQK